MKFLITGGAGFIGSHIAEELVKSKKGEIIVFDNLSVGKKENIPKGCRFIKGDIRNEAIITKATKGVDVVFHDAAFVSIRGSFDMLKHEIENNVYGALNVLEAAAENKVRKLVFASSMAVYGEPKLLPVGEDSQLRPISPYGFSKLRGELYCKIFQDKSGIDTTVLRYFNTFGIRQTPSDYVGVTTTFINQALAGKPLTIFGNGKQTRDFVWVKDIARANILAAFSKKSRGEIFNIASGNEVSINDIADAINKHTGGSKKYLSVPGGEISRIRADISKARRVLGYRPEGDLLVILPDLVHWWKKQRDSIGIT